MNVDVDGLSRDALRALDSPTPCACGCGAFPKMGSRFKPGHNMPTRAFEMLATARQENQCWTWPGSPDASGYGGTRVAGVMWKAHRWVWTQFRGPIPEGMELDHVCRNRMCVNPDHLEVTTHWENGRRGIGPCAVNARKTHCKHGHEFTPENTKPVGTHRRCRACIKRRNTETTERRRQRRLASGADSDHGDRREGEGLA